MWPRRRSLTWSIVTSAPKGEAGAQWGDTWFANDLADALRRRGQRVSVRPHAAGSAPGRDDDDVVVVLRGLKQVLPRRARTRWMLWVISHPELVTADEASAYDAVYAASGSWSRAADLGALPLLQATNARRFTPTAAPGDSGEELLFVGSTRGEFRPAVAAALAAGLHPTIYGVGWDRLTPAVPTAGEFLANDALPAAYASAHVVLNDHWPDMAREGFLSNRLFDAAATATRVVSDAAVGLEDVFGTTVRTFAGSDDLASIVRDTAVPGRAERLELAARIARDHSFDARAAVLLSRARALGAGRRR